MRASAAPRVHLFVCANRREGSPLGPGCADRGEAVYDALKREVSRRRLVADVWVTKTHCLGICPKGGATVARYGGAQGLGTEVATAILSEVDAADAGAILDHALAAAGRDETPRASEKSSLDWATLEGELAAIEELQKNKVFALARRLKPGLTAEDIQNPHDFPELDDPDWHYADGILTGIQSVTSAMRALRKRRDEPNDRGGE
ncbi:hypothetical protein AKJ09_11359 [Labilithrix luteola]|uniref:Uncharacterized protein n=1 Tax=Labilithrix luteola TaxID=1391654 RepID=A0A0K1QFZ6_9BACT|nr:(2Fe-2S) ferredoxin domain-containing protein [Labilithrix luteola]AKV04696.1 hypothetical protein AKJ09_11359 [Labilithrix luteola]